MVSHVVHPRHELAVPQAFRLIPFIRNSCRRIASHTHPYVSLYVGGSAESPF
jgi:hypothetical protein